MLIYKMNHFIFNKNTELCEIMGKNKSDKGNQDIINSWHNYTIIYYGLFKNIKDQKLNIFEMGIGTNNINIESNMGVDGRPGASLYGWSEFFPNSNIYGADIDKDVLFNTERIKTFFCDQTNQTLIKKLWNHNIIPEYFDIIIDDGLHTLSSNVCFFENSIHKLNKNGYFIIEDITINYEKEILKKIKEWKQKYKNLSFNYVKVPSEINNYDNNLLIIKNNIS